MRPESSALGEERSADVMLRTKMSAGHDGVSGRHNAWRDRAFTLAWLVDRIGRS